nr:retrotransposon protein Ty1-copia subclass [Tanacetum cinerariifolium]
NVILEKIIIDLEDEVVDLLEKEKANLETIESLKSKGFESSQNVSSESENQTENDCLVVEKECNKEENPNVIAPGMFKLNVSQFVSPILMSKSSCDSNNVDIKLKRKRRKRKSSKQNVKQVDNDVSRANSDFVHFSDLDTFSSDDYFQEIINPDFEKIDSPFQQTSSLKPYVSNVILEKIIIDLEDEVVNLLEKKKCDKEENPKVIAPGMFKLNVSQCASPISMSKSSCESNDVEIKLKRKRRKRKPSKQNVKQVNNDVSRANNDFVHFLDLDTFSSVRLDKNSGVIWKKKWSSNTSNVFLTAVNVSNLNKNVKRYYRKDLLACNNSHLGETSSAYMCNDAMNVSCDSRMNDLLDDNNFFIFDDESVKISPVSKMPFRKKPRDSMHVRSKSNMIKSLPRTVYKWLSKMQPLAELVAKWFPRVKRQIDKISMTPNSPGPIYKWHMMGNRALLTNSVEKFLRMVRFGNNDFSVIADYGDVVIGSLTIKKVYYIKGFGHNLFSVGQFCLPKMKFEKDHLCSACEQGKIHQKHHKSKTAFASNKPLYPFHMDLCGPMRVQSINGKRYVLVVVDDYSRYTWVFFLHSKDEASEVIISFIKKTQVNLQLQVQRVRIDNGTEFKNKTLAKFFDEVGITQKIFAARTPQQNGVVERRNRNLVEAARTMLTLMQ